MKALVGLRHTIVAALILTAIAAGMAQGRSEITVSHRREEAVSFTKDIAPIIGRRCLPCHAEDNFNPSELSLDSYQTLMEGGKHGTPIVPWKARESIIVQKTSTKPPFGDRMPLNPRKKIEEGAAKWLTDAELRILAEWINQGARKN